MHIRFGIPLLAIMMTACNGTPPPAPRAASAPEASPPSGASSSSAAPAVATASTTRPTLVASELLGTHWHLTAASAGELATHGGATGITLEFGADKVTGFGGCNRYSASYSLADGVLTAGPVAATKRGCPGDADAIERAWHEALAAPLSLAMEGRELRVGAAAGAVLSFAPGPAPGAQR